MLVSICIPVYEFHGKGVDLLQFNLQQIEMQTYEDIQVVVSDNSSNNDIFNYISSYSGRLLIKYVQNDPLLRYSGQHNFNNAIRHADGDIISIICQDDYFVDNLSIERIVTGFSSAEVKWLITGHQHIKNGEVILKYVPTWNDKIILGFNYIGPPSVLSMRRGYECYFDTNVIYYSDCELYQQLYFKYGAPKIIPESCVIYRIWDGQGSSYALKYFDFDSELSYLKSKYNLPTDSPVNKPKI